MTIRVEKHLSDDDPMLGEAWSLYRRAFAPLAAQAVQRHVMYSQEFVKLAQDQAVGKYLWIDDRTGRLSGLAMYTNALHHVDLISTQYFAKRWPDQYREGRIYYVIFVCTDRRDMTAFEQIINHMQGVAGPGAIVAMDSCNVVDERGMPRRALQIVRANDPGAQCVDMDTQTYRAWILSSMPDQPTFSDRRAAADQSVDHASHSTLWAGDCPECP